jgi:hypothetical protein
LCSPASAQQLTPPLVFLLVNFAAGKPLGQQLLRVLRLVC